jgi:hypothetical protein
LSKDQEKSRDLEGISAKTAVASEKDRLLGEMVQSLQGANIQQSIITTLVTDLATSVIISGFVNSIDTFINGNQAVTVITDPDRRFYRFVFPEPNKLDKFFSELQRAHNNDLYLNVAFKEDPAGLKHFIKSVMVIRNNLTTARVFGDR